MATKPKIHLTLHLAKKGTDLSAVVGEEAASIKLKTGGRLYVRPAVTKKPNWLRFFGSAVEGDVKGLYTASCGAAVVIPHAGRIFALTFGQGRHLLNDDVLEPSFGLRVVANAVNPDRIRHVDRDSLDTVGRRTREQLSKEDSITTFGLNVDQDLVRALAGSSTDQDLGGRIAGADSLVLNVPVTFSGIEPVLEKCLTLFRSTKYKDRFDFIDHISPVRDETTRQHLDSRLVTKLREKEVDRIWLAVPEVIDWTRVAGFRYLGWRSKENFDDVYMPQFLDAYEGLDELDLESLKQMKVASIDPETSKPALKWRLYNCIYAEIEDKGHQYLLNAGEWFRVDVDFVESVDRAVKQILKGSTTAVKLPPYHDQSEGEYNARVCAQSKGTLALMDADPVPYAGSHNKIEFCDIYTRTRCMCHIKRYGASSVLSHLFSQGVVAAEAFLADSEFRGLVNAKLPKAFRLADPALPLDSKQFEVVFGITSKADETLQLPFFSRVTLRNAHRRLSAMGYRVSLVRIPVQT
jgi:uncharacterized protein (TIGR04141 family)